MGGTKESRGRGGDDSTMRTLSPWLLLIPAASALLPAATFPRQVLPFDYAWRFRKVQPAKPPAPPPPPRRKECPAFNATSPATCSGLTATPAGNGSAASCRQQCCTNADCFVWQYSLAAARDRCWTGQCKSPGPDVPTWISQAAPAPSKPPPTPPAPTPPESGCMYCGVEVDDSQWELIDAPHDFIITQPISETENNGAGSVSAVVLVPTLTRRARCNALVATRRENLHCRLTALVFV